MSCLILADMSLSEQIALECERADRLIDRARAFLAPLDALAANAVTPCTAPAASASNPLPAAEHPAMVEHQYRQHPALLVCAPGHIPRMYEARGNCTTTYYVECQLCNVRTAKRSTPEGAASDWSARDVGPIHTHVSAVA